MNYDDIINLKRPKSKYPKLSDSSRAAQFSPFAALTGYNEEVKEVARLTNKKIIIDESLKEILDYKIQYLNRNIKNNNNIKVIYFEKDSKKDGGKYIEINGILKKIDFIKKEIKVENTLIKIDNILNITSEILKEL